jgi:quercetin dioxygenase-like cupin family protein
MPNGDDKAARRLIAGRPGDVKRMKAKAGTETPDHTHLVEQFLMVVSGSGVLILDSEEVEMLPGMVVHFEPGVTHSIRFETDTILYEVTPRPEDKA